MKKYYAVLKGRGKTPAIYTSWDECREKVEGYPDAKFKGFKELKNAEEYIGEYSKDDISKPTKKGLMVAYVDGSFSVSKNNYSYGVVILKDNKIIKTINGAGKNEKAAQMRQIYGELKGVMKAVDYALSAGEKELHVYYDYNGIENWAIGKWNRNNEFTQKYHEFMQKKMKEIKVFFHKVKAHSGDKYNEMADRLAKEALR